MLATNNYHSDNLSLVGGMLFGVSGHLLLVLFQAGQYRLRPFHHLYLRILRQLATLQV